MHRSIALLVCALAAATATAQPITIGETITIRSLILGEDRTILVSTPAGYARSQERYPVLYVTDGDAHLTHTRGTVDFLSGAGLIPNLIVVGVANTDRTRDLTPTHGFRTRDDGVREDIPNSGGGGRFLEFFATELLPYVDSHYRTQPFRILAGHSLGGMFALHALFSRPELFNAAIAASPALQWDDDLVLRRTDAFLRERGDFSRALFVTMANEEAGDPGPTRFERLTATLGAAKASGFRWGAKLMPEETHGTVVLRSHYWGLRMIFEGWQLPGLDGRRARPITLAGLDAHYAALSSRLGFAVTPSEVTVNQVGYTLLLAGDLEGALEVFRRNVSLYPDAPNVHDSLGEALERAGRIEEAAACYSRAVERAAAVSDPRLDIFTRNRDRAAAATRAEAATGPAAGVAALDLVEVSPSVVMARHTVGANSACIALDDGLVFVDAGMSTADARRFRQAMEARFGKPTRALVLTHAHIDHILGMGAFADVRIAAAEGSRPVYERLAATRWDEETIVALAAVFPSFREAVRDAKLAVPGEFFTDRLAFGPAGRQLVVARAGGHTADSSYADFAPEGVIFAGDLVQAHRRPYFGEPDTDLAAWVATLRRWHAMEPASVCPGHGPVVDRAYLPGVWQYFEALTAAVAKLKAEGLSVERIAVHPSLPVGYWGGGDTPPRWWGACVARVWERI